MDTFERRRPSSAPSGGDAADARLAPYRIRQPNAKERRTASAAPFHATDAADVRRDAAAARDGDRKALRALFNRYKDAVYRIALMLLSSHAAAERVTEDVFVQYYENGPSADVAFEKWVFRATVAVCRRYMTEPAEEEGPPARLGVDEPDRATAIRRLIAAELAALPPAERVAFVLRESAGFSHAQIAEVTDTSAASVSEHLARARSELSGVLERIEFEGWNAG